MAIPGGEVAAHTRRFEAHRPKIAFANARIRLVLDALEEPGQPTRRFVALERTAAQAVTIAGEERLLWHGEELDVLRLWFSGRARRPAEDARRTHAKVEHAVIR